VKPDRKDAFQAYVDRVLEALPRQPGLVGYSIRREIAGDRVWTLTAWRNEQARAAFVGSPIHAEAMARALPTLRATRFARVERAPGEGPPTWSEALRWLEESGREYSNTAR
jgi:quinol monooxygenase YgiN